MRISTKKGDHGETGLFNGKRVKKSDPIIKIIGELDELNSFLGFAKVSIMDIYVFDVFERVQKDIYRIMSVIGNEMKPPKDIKAIKDEDIECLEKQVEKLENSMSVSDKFVVPGESELSARIHLVRSVCRRAERTVVEYTEELKIPLSILKYLNRLSDLLFLLAHEDK